MGSSEEVARDIALSTALTTGGMFILLRCRFSF